MLVRILGIIAVIAVIGKATKLGESQLTYIMNMTKIATTQTEVTGISRMIYTDLIVGNDAPFPDHDEQWWADYLKQNLHSDIPTRDCARDMWLTPYQIRRVDNIPGTGGAGFMVRSAGPDAKFDTGDDIIVYNGSK